MIVKSIKAFRWNNKWWQFEQFICLYLKPGIKWEAPTRGETFLSRISLLLESVMILSVITFYCAKKQ